MIILTYARDYNQVVSRVVLRQIIMIWLETIVSTMKECIPDMICMSLRHATSNEKHADKGGYSHNRHSLHNINPHRPDGEKHVLQQVHAQFPHASYYITNPQTQPAANPPRARHSQLGIKKMLFPIVTCRQKSPAWTCAPIWHT